MTNSEKTIPEIRDEYKIKERRSGKERRLGKGRMDIFDAVIEMLFYDEMPRRQVKRLYLAARQRMLIGKVRRPK